jgi:hypothetical protein
VVHVTCANICSIIIYPISKKLSHKADLTDEEIGTFQAKADDNFWINFIAYDGVTNYVHMLGAGHIRLFIR